ncbi:MAG: S9 family peptidase [Luteibaculaceae bacterium]
MKHVFLLLALTLSFQFVSAQAILTPEKIWQMRQMGTPQVSPDNKTVVYSVREMDPITQKSTTNFFAQTLANGETKRLNTSDLKLANYFFNQAGELIGVTNKAFYIIDVRGNKEPFLFKESDEPINGAKLSNNGETLAFYKSVKVRVTPQELHPDLPNTDVKIYDDLMYRHWDSYQDEFAKQVFITSMNNSNLVANAKNLLENTTFESPHPPFAGSEDYTFSPDGKFFVYVSKKLTGKDAALSTNTDLYLVDLVAGTTLNLTEANKGYDLYPKFSPNGKFLAWQQMKRDGYESDKNDIVILDLTTNKQVNVTENWDGTISNFTWSADSKKMYAIAPTMGTQQIFVIDFKGKPTATIPKQLTTGYHNFTTVMEAGKILLATQTLMHRPAELFKVDPKKGTFEQITTINADKLENLTVGTVKHKMIPASDGKEILTWIIYPPNFDSTKTYPTLLYCQGGPQSQVSHFFSTRWNLQLMAANGYIVVAPNRRGLPGFGVEWNEAISKDWGGQPMRDYLAAIDYMAKKPYVDENNLGAVGASYGGYSVFYLAGIHEGRFKAFISHCGLFNLESWYGTTEELFFANWDIGGAYWDEPKPASYLKFSPHMHAHKWDTPMLVIHGGKDFRVPESEGMQAFQVLQLKGIPSRFLYFPNENHWVLKPQNSILWHREFKSWLDTYLKN